LGVALLFLSTPATQAALNLVTLAPANDAVNVSYDTHLQITFDAPPSFTNSGRIVIYNSSGVPVDTNDLSLSCRATVTFQKCL
jgi:hypothetical protein